MENRAQQQPRVAGGVAVTECGDPDWRRRGGLREAARAAPAALDNKRIRELLGWGLLAHSLRERT